MRGVYSSILRLREAPVVSDATVTGCRVVAIVLRDADVIYVLSVQSRSATAVEVSASCSLLSSKSSWSHVWLSSET